MGAPGWRKLGDNGEDLCRLLDNVHGSVEALKTAVRRGERLEGFEVGVEKVDLRSIWCPELCRSSSDEVPASLETGKLALRRMKDVKKALGTVLGSLEGTINSVTDSIALDCRAAGLASLPDELLAPILELCYRDFSEGIHSDFLAKNFSGMLASVCRRFCRVAMHLPSLWKHIFGAFPPRRLSFHTARSSTLCVHLDGGFHRRVANTVDEIHPNRYWEELDLDYMTAREGYELFQDLNPRITTPFVALKRLTITYDRQQNEEEASAAILETEMRKLGFWSFPNLTRLNLRNFLPSVPMHLSNATSVKLSFHLCLSGAPVWSQSSQRDLLQSMPQLVSLTIEFICFKGSFNPTDHNASVEPVVLPSLRTLDIRLTGQPPVLIVSSFMDLVDTERLTKLTVLVNQSIRWGEQSLNASYRMRREFSVAWVTALFSHITGSPRPSRTFSAVKEFSLDVAPIPDLTVPSFTMMYFSFPNVQRLSLALPASLKVDLCEWAETYGGLRELRSLRICERTPSGSAKYSEFIQKLSGATGPVFTDERRTKFERLEVNSSSNIPFQEETFEKYLGDKLVWLGTKGD